VASKGRNREILGTSSVAERSYQLKADEIHRLRLKKGLSLKKLADEAEVHPRTLRRWLNGEGAQLENVVTLAKKLDTKVENLLIEHIPNFNDLLNSETKDNVADIAFVLRNIQISKEADVDIICQFIVDSIDQYYKLVKIRKAELLEEQKYNKKFFVIFIVSGELYGDAGATWAFLACSWLQCIFIEHAIRDGKMDYAELSRLEDKGFLVAVGDGEVGQDVIWKMKNRYDFSYHEAIRNNPIVLTEETGPDVRIYADEVLTAMLQEPLPDFRVVIKDRNKTIEQKEPKRFGSK
jgi:transcriptional regulator with XRE-family HTH domain